MKIRQLPPIEYLQECFIYKPNTGQLFWKERPAEHFSTEQAMKIFNTRYANKEIKTTNSHGYKRVQINKHRYFAHRVIWKLYYGRDPIAIIDHINRDPSDNRIENLRDTSFSENLSNMGLRSTNTSGYKNITWRKHEKKWQARITIMPNKQKHLGLFENIHDAVKARDNALTNGEQII